MRERMRKEHRADDIWLVKHMPGGMVDIEFIAQYLQLKHAAETPEILAGDTAAALRVAGDKGLIDASTASDLVDAMMLWRSLQGILRLTVEGDFSEAGTAVALKRMITRSCGAVDFDKLKQTMQAMAERSAAHFGSFFERPENQE